MSEANATASPALSRALARLQTGPPPPTEDRHRLRPQAVARLAADLGPRYAPERASLAMFRVYHPAQGAVLDRLRRLADCLAELAAAGSGLVFLGTVGTGKDHLLAAMLYQAARQGLSCRWV